MTTVLTQTLVAWLLYPGVLTGVGLSVAYALLMRVRIQSGGQRLATALGDGEGMVIVVSMLCAVSSLALLPWPWHPTAPTQGWIWAWVLLELAFLLPLLPALAAGEPATVRAAIREVQLGVAARSTLWITLATGLLINADWRLPLLPAHLLALTGALVAFPAAIGWGPFGAETGITPGGSERGLAPATLALALVGRVVRNAALLAAALVAVLPHAVLPPGLGLLILAAGFGLAGLLLQRFAERLPRMPLPAALHYCWLRALPVGLLALLYLAIV